MYRYLNTESDNKTYNTVALTLTESLEKDTRVLCCDILNVKLTDMLNRLVIRKFPFLLNDYARNNNYHWWKCYHAF